MSSSSPPAASPMKAAMAAGLQAHDEEHELASYENPDLPYEVVSIDVDGHKFTLNEKPLKRILERAEAINSERCVVISVVGAFRSGKSFLLDLMLRFLRYEQAQKEERERRDAAKKEEAKEKKKDEDDEEDDGHSTTSSTESPVVVNKGGVPDWLLHGGDHLLEGNVKAGEEKMQPGFNWRGGRERMTTGIWMYGRPFERQLPSGETVPVILMDTQGMFDLKTSHSLTAAIFGLSTLISSVQVYNLSKQIQEDHLEQLNYFTQFSLVALKEFSKAQARALEANKKKKKRDDEKNKQNKQKKKNKTDDDDKNNEEDEEEEETKKKGEDDVIYPFQRIQFLVRDWANFMDEEDIEGCIAEMPHVLDDAMADNVKDQGTREQIKKAFESISCFLLPHPGLPVAKVNFSGHIHDIEPLFLQLLHCYVDRLFHHELVVKKVQGRDVTPRQLGRYIEAYTGVFRHGKLPQTMTLVEAISATTNLCAKDDAYAIYKRIMDPLINAAGSVEESMLVRRHEEAVESAMEHYESVATFGDEKHIQDIRVGLTKTIEEEFERAKEQNSMKMQARLVKYIFPIIIASAALILDIFTDWTCDSWSLSCRQLSRAAAFVYYATLFLVLIEFGLIYSRQGSVAAGMGAMALGRAVLKRTDELKEELESRLNQPPPVKEKEE